METEKLENLIRQTLKNDVYPSRNSLQNVLLLIPEQKVTLASKARYSIETIQSNFINLNKIIETFSEWKSKKIILVPSFLFLVFIGLAFVSPHASRSNLVVQQIAEQGETVEEPGIDDDQQILNNFDSPAIDELSATQNEF